MKASFNCVVLLLICATQFLQAQTCLSRKLSEIGELFPKICLPPKDSIFNCPQITKGKSFIVQYNHKNEIEHLGVSLFSPATKEMINLPVCNFIERIMLELLLQKSTADVRSKLEEYQINLHRNGVEYGRGAFISLSRLLSDIQNPTRFIINKDAVYIAVWEFGNNEQFLLSFPASRELIFGTDKKESDTSIGELLVNDDCAENFTAGALETIAANELTPVAGTDLYKRKGDIFMIDKINTDTWYQRSDTLYRLVFDSAYPYESLANLVLTKQIKNSLLLKITHRMYGGFTPEFTIPLNRFFCLFDKGFTAYCLLRRTDPKSVKILVILHNHDFNYFHLLDMQTTVEQLFKSGGILTADFYTNIPLHNLKSLFN
ncbi:MAG: hypothetical protein FWD60_03545 [Candidatus Azobacteroides sp.]|nr:hypothetical protein [Candidatus Azobacteroides sp.]